MGKKVKKEKTVAEVPEAAPEAVKPEAPKGASKVDQAYTMYQELKSQNLKPKEIFGKIAEALGISARAARSYVWRAEHPAEFKAMLERYYAKRKGKTASE